MSNDKGIPGLADLIGVPFKDRGRNPSVGLDCWGLVMEVQRRMGRNVPDYGVPCFDSAEINAHIKSEGSGGRGWAPVSCPEPGDVVVIETNPDMPGCVDHCGVYIGAGRFIHAIQKLGVSAPKLMHISLFGKHRGYYRWVG